MQDIPPEIRVESFTGFDKIECIMSQHDDASDDQQRGVGKIEQQECAQDDHADANGPDHLKRKNIEERIKGPRKGNQCPLGHDEPEASLHHKKTKFFFGLAKMLQIDGRAGEQHKDRRTEMGNPAGEIKWQVVRGDVQRVGRVGGDMEIIADMIERHDDHDNAAQHIDGFNPFCIDHWSALCD